MASRKPDTLTLVLAGGVAAALIGAAGASSWVWLRQRPGETARAHRKRASQFTSIAFAIAGAIGAGAGAALLGPRAAGQKDWGNVLERLVDGFNDLRDRADQIERPHLSDLRKRADRWLH